MGFKEESLETEGSKEKWQHWKDNKCQPNFWMVRNSSFFQNNVQEQLEQGLVLSKVFDNFFMIIFWTIVSHFKSGLDLNARFL